MYVTKRVSWKCLSIDVFILKYQVRHVQHMTFAVFAFVYDKLFDNYHEHINRTFPNVLLHLTSCECSLQQVS